MHDHQIQFYMTPSKTSQAYNLATLLLLCLPIFRLYYQRHAADYDTYTDPRCTFTKFTIYILFPCSLATVLGVRTKRQD